MHGRVDIKDSWKYFGKEVGAIEYLLLDKDNDYHLFDKELTKFPANMKIINYSRHLPRKKQEEIETKVCDYRDVRQMIDKARFNEDCRVNTKGHFYKANNRFDNFCLDRGTVYGQGVKELFDELPDAEKQEAKLIEELNKQW